MKKFFLSVGLLSLLFTTIACSIGLGEEVDLAAPEITITSPKNLDKVGLNFTLCGTCTDNIKVVDVVIKNVATDTVLGNASIDGEEWSFPISLTHEDEGEISFSCTVSDEAGNSSTKSTKIITLLVDETAPSDLSWYVDRGNGIQTPLISLETLQELDTTISENKDYPQNQEFTVNAHFYDAISINEITLNLIKEDETVLLSKTVSSDSTNTNFIGNTSIFTPKFKFTQEELVAADASFASGKHYLKLSYSCKDDHGNSTAKDLDWMLWYPESDIPGINQSFIQNNAINVGVKTSLPINIFDDDGLQEYKCALLQTSTFTAMRGTSSVEQAAGLLETDETFRNKVFSTTLTVPSTESVKFENTLTGTRDTFVSVTAPQTPCDMYLLACAKDIYGTWKSVIIPTYVTDANAPLLYIQGPTENAVPTLDTNKKFKIYGYTLDSNGSANVKIVYIPDSTDNAAAEATAKQILNADTTPDDSSKLDYANGIKLWNHKLGTGSTDPVTNWLKQDFEFEFCITDTNVFAEDKRCKEKFFELLVIDTDGNKVFRQFKVDGDDIAPTLDIKSPAADMEICDYANEDLLIKFKASKTTGAEIVEYKVSFNGENKSLTKDGDYQKVTISKTVLNSLATNSANPNIRPVVEFWAKDEFGNEAYDKRTVVLSSKPTLNSISSDMQEGPYKIGDEIRIKAKYSAAIQVTGTPRIKLKNITSTSSNPIYANYASGSETDTLVFTYIVEEGQQSSKIQTNDSLNPIELNNGTIGATKDANDANTYLTSYSNNVFASENTSKIIKIDGVKPTINSITVKGPVISGTTTKTYVKGGDILTATVAMSETVNIGGSPTLALKTGSTSLNFTFQSVNGNNVIFEYPVDSTLNGAVNYNLSTAFSATDLLVITDTAGNTTKEGTNKNVTTGITIDNNAPVAPSINIAAGSYSSEQSLELSGIETGATAEYSKDGGISWTTYSTPVTLSNGNHTITTRQTDRAGNISSPLSPAVSVNINNAFPALTGFTIKKSDGHYKKDTQIEVKMTFDGEVKASVGQISLEFKNTDGNKSGTIAVTPTESSNSLSFIYTVGATDYFDGMKITKVNYNGFTDVNGNSPSDTNGTTFITANSSDLTRPGIVLDGIAPTVSTKVPAQDAISTYENNSFKVRLTFRENVYKETGNIILQRKGDWYIPPVMTSDEFLKYYNKMDSTNKQKVMKTDASGQEIYHSQTGIAIGPYRKITHGLKLSGTNYVPDESTKYVLAYDLGLDSGTATLDTNQTVSVADIRSALESVDYHRHFVDVASSNVVITGSTVEITFQDVIENGREWELIIPDTAFRDDAENFYTGMEEGDYSFWSKDIATPVVRVDRYSHGWGAKEPDASGTLTTITANNGKYKTTCAANTGARVAPTGYARSRIDCETPGVTIKYKTVNKGEVAYNDTSGLTTETNTYYTNKRSKIADAAKTDLEFSTDGITYTSGNNIIIGDTTYTSARKDYISCYATKTGFTQSKNGMEGVFRTVVYIHTENKRNNNYYAINIEGGTAPGGQPNVSGFPLRDATSENDPNGAGRYSKNAYNLSNSQTPGQNFVWVSYEIISSNWAILVCRSNHGREYPLNNYGDIAYLTSIEDWNGTK